MSDRSERIIDNGANGMLTWDPPGPGSWQLVADHYPRPMTQITRDFATVWSEATTGALHAVGFPVDRAEMACVNGMPYVAFHAGGGGRVPPPWMLKILVRVVPSLRRSERRLCNAIETRVWSTDARRWYDVERPAAIARQRELTDVDPSALDGAELAQHLRELHAQSLANGSQHISMGMSDALGIGMFVVACQDWNIDASVAFGLLAGASPASTGAPPELRTLRRAVAGRHVTSLAGARGLGDDVAAALDEYLAVYGHRVVDGYDVDCPTLVERPDLVLHLLVAPEPADRRSAGASALESARAAVPVGERSRFDQLLADAREAYGVRDDNNGILVGWSTGLLRRAMLAAGHLLARRGELADASLAIEAGLEELVSALAGTEHLDSVELQRRRAFRAATRSSDAPRRLGPPEPPPPVGMPGALGTAMRVFAIYEFAVDNSRPLQGSGIGSAAYTGRACIVCGGLDGGGEFEPGDVLVAPMTSPSYNVLLSLAGAVVTEEGGVMSHAAIMARELALPAVLGAARATELIADGDTVTVDPLRGTVSIVEKADRV